MGLGLRLEFRLEIRLGSELGLILRQYWAICPAWLHYRYTGRAAGLWRMRRHGHDLFSYSAVYRLCSLSICPLRFAFHSQAQILATKRHGNVPIRTFYLMISNIWNRSMYKSTLVTSQKYYAKRERSKRATSKSTNYFIYILPFYHHRTLIVPSEYLKSKF